MIAKVFSGPLKRWKDKLLRGNGPELVFALLGFCVYLSAILLQIGAKLEHTLAIIVLLVLVSQVLIRSSFKFELGAVSDLRAKVESLGLRIDKFGLAAQDHATLDKLARNYIDQKAEELARIQRALSHRESCSVPVDNRGDLFRELETFLDCANRDGLHIRAISSQRLSEYIQPGPAQHYFDRYTREDFKTSCQRIFVLDTVQLAASQITDLLLNQELHLQEVDRERPEHIRWLYRRRDEHDTETDPHHDVPHDFAVDWILFGEELLVEHEQPGAGFAHITIDRNTIDTDKETFNNLWKRGRPVAELPAGPAPLPADPRLLRETASREVGAVEDVVTSRDEVA